MKLSTFCAPIVLATYFSFALLFIAGTANAGVVVKQAHPFKVGGTIFSQGVNEKNNDDILEKDRFNEKDIGANCTFQDKLAKDEFVILVLNNACFGGDLNDNEIQIVNTDPFFVIATIGEIDFDQLDLIVAQKNSVDKTLTVPATVELDCDGALVIDVEASAIATIKLNKEGTCVDSLSMKSASGTGDVDGTAVILDGIKVSASKKKAAILGGGG